MTLLSDKLVFMQMSAHLPFCSVSKEAKKKGHHLVPATVFSYTFQMSEGANLSFLNCFITNSCGLKTGYIPALHIFLQTDTNFIVI